jgi:diacylglycerol O-acyltransferase
MRMGATDVDAGCDTRVPAAAAEAPSRPRPALPRPPLLARPRGWRELALGLAIFGVYLLLTHRIQVSHHSANAHARALLRFERALGMDVERPLDRWLAAHRAGATAAAWQYAISYIVTTFGFAGWLWWRRPDHYRWARNLLAASTLLALAAFAWWPVTPPRLLPATAGHGFPDVVASVHPPLSWGSGTVSAGADQWAAMPSLHVGWAVWVAVVSWRAGVKRLGLALAGVDLVVTTYVVLATGNHYVLDVVGGLAVVAAGALLVAAGNRLTAGARRTSAFARIAAPVASPTPGHVTPLTAADAFFVHVETPQVPQVVGGVALLDTTDAPATGVHGGVFDVRAVRAQVARRLPHVPQFTRRLEMAPRQRPRWRDDPDVDLDWHVRDVRLPAGTGRRGLERFVADRAAELITTRRPPWRMWLVEGVGPGEAAAVVLMHHAVGDGIGVVDILRQFLDPQREVALPDGVARAPSLTRVAGVLGGVASLAVEGTAPQLPFNRAVTTARAWRTLDVPLRDVRTLARASGTSVTDVMLAAVGEVLRPAAGTATNMRVAVPLTLRSPRRRRDAGAERASGNLTAAVRVTVPLGDTAPARRLARVHASTVQRYRVGRVAATAAVIRAIGALPAGLHRRAARAMYRAKFFNAIVTNIPGPSQPRWFAGFPLKDVYPVVPLADGVPLAVGALSWNGRLCVSVTADPTLVPEARDIDVALRGAFDRLAGDLGVAPFAAWRSATRREADEPATATGRHAWPSSSA